MGDRANVVVTDMGHEVYLYTHWHGHELPQMVHRAISRGVRWDDCSYLTRIIFSEMIKDELMEETGFGISSSLGDGDSQMIYVDVPSSSIRICSSYGSEQEYSFREFTNLDEGEVGW